MIFDLMIVMTFIVLDTLGKLRHQDAEVMTDNTRISRQLYSANDRSTKVPKYHLGYLPPEWGSMLLINIMRRCNTLPVPDTCQQPVLSSHQAVS